MQNLREKLRQIMTPKGAASQRSVTKPTVAPKRIVNFFAWMLAFTMLSRATYGALLPVVRITYPGPNSISQILEANGMVTWAANDLFYVPEGLLVEQVFAVEGSVVDEETPIAQFNPEEIARELHLREAQIAQMETERAGLNAPYKKESSSAANAAQSVVLADQIQEIKMDCKQLNQLLEQDGILYASQGGCLSRLELVQGQRSGEIAGTISNKEKGLIACAEIPSSKMPQKYTSLAAVVTQGMQSERSECIFTPTENGSYRLITQLPQGEWQTGGVHMTVEYSRTNYDVCLPVSALHNDNRGNFIYTVEEYTTILGVQNLIRKVYVEIAERNSEWVGIRNYEGGDAVVVSSTRNLKEGACVRMDE